MRKRPVSLPIKKERISYEEFKRFISSTGVNVQKLHAIRRTV